MRKKLSLLMAFLLTGLPFLNPDKAMANGSTTLYKDDATDTWIWIIENPTSPTIKVRWDQYGIANGVKTASFITNICGVGSFSLPQSVTKFNVGGQEFIPTAGTSAPTCNEETTSSNLPENTAIRVGSKVFLRYLPDPTDPAQQWGANWPDIRERKATPNQCGFVQWKAKSISEIEVNGTMVPWQQITTKPLNEMPICRKVGNSYVKYVRQL